MTALDLRALQSGDADAWDEAFAWLWPAAIGAAQLVLMRGLSHEAEDVAIEALEEMKNNPPQFAHVSWPSFSEIRVSDFSSALGLRIFHVSGSFHLFHLKLYEKTTRRRHPH
jgi:hypothetical protein